MDNFKFNITTDKDLGKLKITKVKPWCIYFNYDSKHYMIHETEDNWLNTHVILYERIFNGFGNIINCKMISNSHGNNTLNISDFINKYKTVKSNGEAYSVIYSKIDKIHFVNGLYKYGFNKECIHSNKLKNNNNKIKIKSLIMKREVNKNACLYEEITSLKDDKIYKPIISNNLFRIPYDKAKQFIEESNKNKISNEFINECKESSKLFFKNTITIKKDKLYKLINSLDKTLLKLGKSDTGDLQFCMEDEFNELIKSINKLKEELGYDKTYSKDYYFYGEEEAL